MKIPIVGTIEPDGRVAGLLDQQEVDLSWWAKSASLDEHRKRGRDGTNSAPGDGNDTFDDIADEATGAADVIRELAEKLPTDMRFAVLMAANSLDAAAIRLYGVGEVLRDRDGK